MSADQAVCTCYPGGVNPADYEGPQPWCDEHGQPSVAYRIGIEKGLREAVGVVQEVYDLQCPVRDDSHYIAGARVAHLWWQKVLGGALRDLRRRAEGGVS